MDGVKIPVYGYSGTIVEDNAEKLMYPRIICATCNSSAQLVCKVPMELLPEPEKPAWAQNEWRRVAHDPDAPLPARWQLIYPGFRTQDDTPRALFVCSPRCMRLYSLRQERALDEEMQRDNEYDRKRAATYGERIVTYAIKCRFSRSHSHKKGQNSVISIERARLTLECEYCELTADVPYHRHGVQVVFRGQPCEWKTRVTQGVCHGAGSALALDAEHAPIDAQSHGARR